MKRALAAALLLFGLAAPARATEWLECSAGEGKPSIRLLLGAMNVIAANTIEIEAGGKTWSTRSGLGVIPITKGQAFETPDQMLVDVTDADVNEIVAQLRLFTASDGDKTVYGGTLRLKGLGVWAVSCSGP